MAGPFDFTSGIRAGNPTFLDAFQAGQQQAEALRQKQAQEQAALAMRQDLAALAQNPTPQSIAAASLKYPQLSEQFKRSYDMLGAQQKDARISAAIPVYSAALSGRSDLAARQMRERADAVERSGQADEAQSLRQMADLMEKDPKQATTLAGLSLSSIMGPDKFESTFGKLQSEQRDSTKFPAELRKANAEAATAEVEAGNAPTATVLGNQTKEEAILTAQQNREIADLDAQIRVAGSENERQRLTMDRDKLIAERDQKKSDAANSAQDAIDSANALKAQIMGVKNHPGLDAGTGTLGGIRSYFNSSDASDFRKAVEGLKSPVFLNELSKLKAAGVSLGQVTEVEGKKLEQRIANLDVEQSTPAFRNQVGVLLKDTEKFISKISASGKLPTKGGVPVLTSPRYGQVKEGDINRLMSQNPGVSRETVIQFLQQTGAR